MGHLNSQLCRIGATRYRYTGAALAYNIGGILGGGILGGGIPPVISSALLNSFGSWAVGLMMGGLAVVGLLCMLALGRSPISPTPGRKVHP